MKGGLNVKGSSFVLLLSISAKFNGSTTIPALHKYPSRSEEIPSGFPRYGSGLHTSSTALRDCPRTWVSRKRETCVKPRAVIGHFKADTVLTTNSEHYDRNKNALQSHSTDSQTIG